MKMFTFIREHSERCPGKNFRHIVPGVPLWKYVLRRFSDFDVYVDTDSDRLIAESRADEYLRHVTAYQRSEEHKAGHNPVNGMYSRFIREHVTDNNELLVSFSVTAPFTKVDTIFDAVESFEAVRCSFDCLVPVHSIKSHAFIQVDGGELRPVNFEDGPEKPRSQDVVPVVVPTHAFSVTTANKYFSTGDRIGGRALVYEMDGPETIDIDTEADFLEAVLHAIQ